MTLLFSNDSKFRLFQHRFDNRCVVILILLCLTGACGCGLWLNFYVTRLPVPFLPLGEFNNGDDILSGMEPDPFYQAFLVNKREREIVRRSIRNIF